MLLASSAPTGSPAGSSNENSAFGGPESVGQDARPGGSSGGSGAAVAARAVATRSVRHGRLVRLPAAFCGVVGPGLPTGARLAGVIAYASSLGRVGPFARDVGDAAVVLRSRQPTQPTDASRGGAQTRRCAGERVRGIRLGLPGSTRVEGLLPEGPAVALPR